MEFIKDSGIHIPINYPSISQIKNFLTREIIGWDNNIKEVQFYEILESEILIPRYYKLSEKIVDLSSEGKTINISSKTSPRNDRQKKYIEEFTKRDNGIIRLEPGTGKTYIATQLVSYYKKKTIVITHKDKLLEQWRKEFLEHTTIDDNEIGRLSSSNYKECFSKSIILTTPHVILHAINSKNIDFLNELKKSEIGIMFVDECHVGIGPEQFSKSSIYINAKRTYGLSATPYRSDKMDDILNLHLGDVFYIPPDEKELIKPDIYMFFIDFNVFKYNPYMFREGRIIFSRYYNQIYKSETYNKFLANIIDKLHQKKRKVLVLTKMVNNIISIIQYCKVPKEDIGIFSPGVLSKYKSKFLLSYTDTLDQMESFFNKSVVFSTYSYCRDGNNRIDFDTLLMVTPTSNPEQAIGRILRYCEGKPKPVVFDFVDINGPLVYSSSLRKKVPIFVRMARERYLFYKEKGWNVFTKNCFW